MSLPYASRESNIKKAHQIERKHPFAEEKMVTKSDEHKIQPEEANKAMPPSPPLKKNKKKNYKGVRMRSWGSWVSEIRAPNHKTRIWLGSYSTPEAAARAYDAALLCLKGTSANLNFPISSYNLPPDTILSPKSIQRVAAAAAADTFSDSPTSIAPPSPPPRLPPSSSSSPSSSSTSSPSMYSSPSNHIEDDILLVSTIDAYTPYEADEPMSLITASWYNFDSPKYTDFLNGVLFDPPMFEDVREEGDIRLWNFC